MKRIVLDARYLDGTFSGIGTYSRLLIENLSKVDQTNQYMVIVRPGFNGPLAVGPNFEVFSHRASPVSFHSYFRMHDLIESLRPDIVHCLAPAAPVFYRGAMMITVHDFQPFIDPEFSARRPRLVQAAYSLFYKWAYPAAIQRAKWVLCDSRATRDDAVRFVPGAASKLIVVSPGLEQSIAGKVNDGKITAIREKLALRGRYFLYYGSTRPNKNLPNLLRAFAQLLQVPDMDLEGLKLVLVLKKDRFFADAERVIQTRCIHERVQVVEPLPDDEKQALLAGAHAFMFPTKYEGFGFPPLEAMAEGVPVLAGDSGALPEIVGDAARLVDPDDVNDIARGMADLLVDDDLRARLVASGRVRATVYDWQATARTIRDIYELLA